MTRRPWRLYVGTPASPFSNFFDSSFADPDRAIEKGRRLLSEISRMGLYFSPCRALVEEPGGRIVWRGVRDHYVGTPDGVTQFRIDSGDYEIIETKR